MRRLWRRAPVLAALVGLLFGTMLLGFGFTFAVALAHGPHWFADTLARWPHGLPASHDD
jgi:hypothetical protein